MKVLKGFCYCVTATTDTTVTDDNGLSLTVKAGEQGYFVASTDEVSETGTCTIVQVRGNFNMPTTEAGGGQTYPEGAIVGIGPDGDYASIGEYITYGGGMVYNNKTITKWYGDMPNLTVAYGRGTSSSSYGMFQACTNLTVFNGDLPSLTDGSYMFSDCTSLTSFKGDLSSLTKGNYMFQRCRLTSWDIDLPSLTSAEMMFYGSGLISFKGDLARLTSHYSMFTDCALLTTFEGDLSSLTDGGGMFETCPSLTSFKGDLSGLTYGTYMFYGTKLTNFDSNLSSLQNASDMFKDCKLSKASVERVVNTIFDWSGGSCCCEMNHNITIGVDATEVTISDINNVYTPALVAKGWTPEWERN